MQYDKPIKLLESKTSFAMKTAIAIKANVKISQVCFFHGII